SVSQSRLFPYTTLFRSLYRFDVISRLRGRSFGNSLFDSGALYPVTPGMALFSAPLYLLLFGWRGGVLLLVIAVTFCVRIRIQRLDRKSTRLNSSHDQIS